MATNYFLVNGKDSLMVKKDKTLTNSFKDLLYIDDFTLSQGDKLLDNLKEWNPNKVIEARKKFYVVRSPYQAKSNVYPALIYTHPTTTANQIVLSYRDYLNNKIKEVEGEKNYSFNEETYCRVIASQLIDAIKRLSEKQRDEVLSDDSLLSSQVKEAYKNRPWEFFDSFQTMMDLRTLLAEYLGIRRTFFESDNDLLIPTMKELDHLRIKAEYDSINGLEPKTQYEAFNIRGYKEGDDMNSHIAYSDEDGEQLTFDKFFKM